MLLSPDVVRVVPPILVPVLQQVRADPNKQSVLACRGRRERMNENLIDAFVLVVGIGFAESHTHARTHAHHGHIV